MSIVRVKQKTNQKKQKAMRNLGIVLEGNPTPQFGSLGIILGSLSKESDMQSQTMQKRNSDDAKKQEIKDTVGAAIQQFSIVHKIDLKKNRDECRAILRSIDYLLTSTDVAKYVKTGDISICYRDKEHLKGDDFIYTIEKISLKKESKTNITFNPGQKGPQEEMY
ncbi:MAG: hypothetical protein ACD_80C00113G0005 [uncultured bacterium (gcode 4)]|uniref:Uncharacterized protein n=1 Tax=uncultured bacterium (gcode 4) TaxID=1234023 RepID=K1XIY3_9BACT|nr:MAG: hypothetical protein ACD_80C00113G0005 [uncultured bacterium (gcode 4)]HBB04254.1 hypothetical protein [Candidatus Gracilibacteria bacterium]